MKKAQILVVEDEGIVALEIKDRLENLEYVVVGLASSGEEAIQVASKAKPDLVLMDIILKGDMDGVESAKLIRTTLDIPVVYLTAYSDENTLQRAKITEPFGYILKPFEERELYSSIEMALYKHGMEKKLKESEQWLSTTLRAIGDAVIATDTAGSVTFMNPTAESLTGWSKDESLGKNIADIFKVIDEETGEPVDGPVSRAVNTGLASSLKDYSSKDYILRSRSGKDVPVDYNAASIRNDNGKSIGTVITFHDITERRRADREMRIRDCAMASAINAIAISDLEGKLTYANNSLLKSWGYDLNEILGMKMIDLLKPDKAALEIEGEVKAKGSWMGDLVAIKKGGAQFDVQIWTSIVKDKKGGPICLMSSFIDITELKRAEEKLKSYMDKLEQADLKLEEFTDKISDCLPVAIEPIKDFNALISSEYSNSLDENAQVRLKKAISATEKVGELFEDLLELNTPISVYISLIDLYHNKARSFRE